MRMPLIEECEKEVRRLAIAGSRLAVDDFRLKRVIEPLNQMGAKVPVFKKLGEAVQHLVEGGENDSGKHFLRLAALVHAILYTQAKDRVEEAGEKVECSDFDFLVQPRSVKVIKEIWWALTSSGSGRLEVIRSATQNGRMRDLRWVSPSIRALEDGYGDLADYILNEVLPLYGNGILPEVRQGIDLKGNQGSGRRLKFWSRVDPDGARETVLECLDKGSKAMRLAAIGCLEPGDESVHTLTPLLKSKDLEVTSQVVTLLAQSEVPTLQEQIVGKIFSAEEGTYSSIVFLVGHSTLLDRVLERMRKHWSKPMASKKAYSPLILGLECFLGSNSLLELPREFAFGSFSRVEFAKGWNSKLKNELYLFLLEAFSHRSKDTKKSTLPETTWIYWVAEGLLRIGREEGLRLLMEDVDHSDPPRFRAALMASFQVLPPEESFDRFSTILTLEKDRENRSDVLSEVLSRTSSERVDDRWLELATQKEKLELVCHLMRPGHEAAWKLLDQKADRSKVESPLLFKGFVRSKHADRIPRMAEYLKKNPYALYYLRGEWIQLDSADVQKLKDLCPDLEIGL